jgi:hypothetical protein
MGSFYAGIGSRETPQDILYWMYEYAAQLADCGWWLRSGGAPGADSAFENGANLQAVPRMGRNAFKQIFLPWDGFQNRYVSEDPAHIFTPPSDAAYEVAAQYHPAWQRCSNAARSLHARNSHIILGPALSYPVKFVMCWTPRGEGGGGTGQGIRVAKAWKIPVVDMALDGWEDELRKILL